MRLELDGATLTIADIVRQASWSVVPEDCEISPPPSAGKKMEPPRALIDRLAAGDDPIYAVNTGVGLLANVRIPRDELDQLQRNVIRSHCVGVGDPLSREAVRAMMLIRANVLAKGFSGIRPLVAD